MKLPGGIELLLRVDGVRAYPDRRDLQLFETRPGVPYALRLDCSAGCAGLGIEIEKKLLPRKTGKRYHSAVLVPQLERGCHIAFLESH